jgi:hypothetical protein
MRPLILAVILPTTRNSPTVTVKEPVTVLPAASLAVHVTVVITLVGNTVPEGGVHVKAGGMLMLSVAVTV